MKILRSLVLPALLLSSVVSARPRAFAIRSKATNHLPKAVTTLRGGALGMEGEVAGKLFSLAYLTQGAAFCLAPKQQADFYGWGDHPSTEFLTENLGAAILATGVASYAMLYQGKSVHEALGWCAVGCAVMQLKWLLNGTYKRVGMPFPQVAYTILTNSIYIYAGFNSPDWTDNYFKYVIVSYTLVALHGIFFTNASGAFWGDFPDVEQVTFNAKSFMCFLLVLEVNNYCLIQGVEPAKAVAYASLVGMAYFLDGFFLSNEINVVSKKPTGYVFWLLWFAFNIPAILLDLPVTPPPLE